MHRPVRTMVANILHKRFSYLFFTIVLLFLIRPFVEVATPLTYVTNIFLWFIIISCVWAVQEKRKRRGLVITMAIATILAGLMDVVLNNTVTQWAGSITIVLFLAYAVGSIMFYLFRQVSITTDMIMAAASEYVLIGILWTFLYYVLEAMLPGSFSLSGSEADPSGFLYFSFVTLTTTGYGDVLPISVQARSLSILEMITGQLFIAITLARLVSLYTAHEKGH